MYKCNGFYDDEFFFKFKLGWWDNPTGLRLVQREYGKLYTIEDLAKVL